MSTAVRQGCLLSPLLFILVIDWIMKTTLEGQRLGIQWTVRTHPEDLDFADDLAVMSHTLPDMQKKVDKLTVTSSKAGPNINRKKTEAIRVNNRSEESVKLNGEQIADVEEFTYLGSMVNKEDINPAAQSLSTRHWGSGTLAGTVESAQVMRVDGKAGGMRFPVFACAGLGEKIKSSSSCERRAPNFAGAVRRDPAMPCDPPNVRIYSSLAEPARDGRNPGVTANKESWYKRDAPWLSWLPWRQRHLQNEDDPANLQAFKVRQECDEPPATSLILFLLIDRFSGGRPWARAPLLTAPQYCQTFSHLSLSVPPTRAVRLLSAQRCQQRRRGNSLSRRRLMERRRSRGSNYGAKTLQGPLL
ncbi:hypothetical protein SKAU_G00009670 [Synaphobranchus kaupii]|uniref:Reverse transcriptase domain-containing protein n=1 Tax=Synaphobranchus kaupii TaxID=118154 RepID=A0A9Q1JDE0_SYNKA|nr:hypothetical protein SKAU_G00009670 [Synaphobranchus kaupii]